jgi:hypothetical protein
LDIETPADGVGVARGVCADDIPDARFKDDATAAARKTEHDGPGTPCELTRVGELEAPMGLQRVVGRAGGAAAGVCVCRALVLHREREHRLSGGGHKQQWRECPGTALGRIKVPRREPRVEVRDTGGAKGGRERVSARRGGDGSAQIGHVAGRASRDD